MIQLMLEEFLKSNYNWEKLLSSSPYNLIIKYDGDYVLFKYSQFESDMSLRICQEARGIIFDRNTLKPVCIPFFKFFNYGEPNEADIDWTSDVTTSEKMDGSLMKLWYHNNSWHLSTNGTIDAYKAYVGDKNKTFGMLFEESLGIPMSKLTDAMNSNFTYMFELLHPEIENVVDYYNEMKIYLLAQRDMTTYEETKKFHSLPNIYYPKIYNLANIKDVIDVVKNMNENHEGVVVCDGHFNRVKVKSPIYLMKAQAHNNGVLTDKRIITMFRNDVLDDFLNLMPHKQEYIQEVMSLLNNYAQRQEKLYKEICSLNTRKEIVQEVIRQNGDINYIMARLDKKIETPIDYFHHHVFISKVLSILQQERNQNESENN